VGQKKLRLPEVLSAALESLTPSEIPAFALWLDRYAARKLPIYPQKPLEQIVDLNPSHYFTFTNLETAVIWAAEAIVRQKLILVPALSLLELYEKAFVSGDYDQAANLLDQIEVNTGLSIATLESRISLIHRSKGLEAQKEYTKSITEAASRTIPSFIAFYTSQRNEDNISTERYGSRLVPHIEKQRVSKEVKTYLQNRLIGRAASLLTDDQLVASLSVALSLSVLDTYEALIETLQIVAQRREIPAIDVGFYHAITILDLPDWRLDKLKLMALVKTPTLRVQNLAGVDAMLRGDYDLAALNAVEELAHDRTDVDSLSLLSNSLLHAQEPPSMGSLTPLQTELLALLNQLRSPSPTSGKAAAELAKISQNLRLLRFSPALRGFLSFELPAHFHVGESEAASLFSSSSFLNPCHWQVLSQAGAAALLQLCCALHENSLSVRTAMAALFKRPLSFANLLDREEAIALMICSAVYHNDLDAALLHAQSLSSSQSAAWRQFAAKTEVRCHLLRGDPDNAICKIAAYCCDIDEMRYVFPLRAVLERKRWRDLKHLAGNIALPIILDFYWRTIDETEHETNRRIAYDEFVKSRGVKRPSELNLAEDVTPRSQLGRVHTNKTKSW